MAIEHYTPRFFNPRIFSASVQKYPQRGKRLLLNKNRSNDEREIKKLEIVDEIIKSKTELHKKPGMIDLPRDDGYDIPIHRRHSIKGYVPILDLRTCDCLLASDDGKQKFSSLIEELVLKKITDLNFHLPYLVFLLRRKQMKGRSVQNLIVKRSTGPPFLTNNNEFSQAHLGVGFETMMGIDLFHENSKPFLFEGNDRTTRRKTRIFGEMVLKQIKK